MMSGNDQPQTMILQTHTLGDGDIGISPVLLQAVNQTLDSSKPHHQDNSECYVYSFKLNSHQPPMKKISCLAHDKN